MADGDRTFRRPTLRELASRLEAAALLLTLAQGVPPEQAEPMREEALAIAWTVARADNP